MEEEHEKEETDLISRLPDEIIHHVLHLLPFESATQTIFLSKRWNQAWNQSIISHGHTEDIPHAVSTFLTQNTRKLRFHISGTGGGSLLAVVAPANKLHLNFSPEISQQPSTWHLELNYPTHSPVSQLQSPVSSSPVFCFISTLILNSVSHLTGGAVSKIFSQFCCLESLKLVNCPGLTSLAIESQNVHSKLNHLTVFDCPQLQIVKIKSFRLRTLRLRGSNFPNFKIGYHFNLTDAMFDVRTGPTSENPAGGFDFDHVLLTFKNAEILTFCRWIFEALICPSLSMFRADFQLYRLKELWWIDAAIDQHNIDSLISFLKLCPSLERLFITIDPKSYRVGRTGAYSKLIGEQTIVRNLEMVKLEGFVNLEDKNRLSDALRKIIVGELSVEDTEELGLKHPHMGL